MPRIYVGDIHGNIDAISSIDRWCINYNVDNVIQVGDFGILWPALNGNVVNYFKNRQHITPLWWTCGGNHDAYHNWFALSEKQKNSDCIRLAPNVYWVHRAKVIKIDALKHLFFGGAESIDRDDRVEGVSWWRYETPSKKEFDDFFFTLNSQKPDVVVTHESPQSVDCYDRKVIRWKTSTPINLENVVKHTKYMPKLWYYGHHHLSHEVKINKTIFRCCGYEGGFWHTNKFIDVYSKKF